MFRRRLDRLGIAWLLVHSANEAKALSRNGPDQFLVFAVVADSFSRGIDAAGECRFRHDSAAPDRSYQIVLADDAVAVLHQIDQQVEHLRLHMDRTLCAPEFAPVEIDLVVAEAEGHSWSSTFGTGATVSHCPQPA